MTKRKRILIVDDEVEYRRALEQALKSIGYDLETAEDGAQALDIIGPHIDMVLLDVMMPGMDGFEITRRIRKKPGCEDIPVIVVTLLDSREDRLSAVKAGANDFVSKPIDTLELKVRMRSLLKMKEAQDAVKTHRAELEKTVERRTADLRESEERFRAIFETTPDCIFVKDSDLRYTHVNPAMRKLFDLPESKLIGLTDEEVFGYETGKQIREVDMRVLKGEIIEEEQTRLVSGIPITFHEIRMPMAGLDGEAAGVCGIARNVTERKRIVAPVRINIPKDYPSLSARLMLSKALLSARTDSLILLNGESGSGKDHVARFIHDNSPRANGPYFAINCAAVAQDLAESELFGHEHGAFTGAHRRKRGLLELAEGGTLLLNEIGELSLTLQAKLLTFLDNRAFTRVGGEKSVSVNARLIAATNRDLERAVAEGRFRRDLYYRLNVAPITVPPLRDRIEDLPLLVREIVEELAETVFHGRIPEIDPDAMQSMKRYSWPGNVRELRNVLERALMLSGGETISGSALGLKGPEPDWFYTVAFPEGRSLHDITNDIRRSLVIEALRRTGGAKRNAAKLLGISHDSLYRFIKNYRIDTHK